MEPVFAGDGLGGEGAGGVDRGGGCVAADGEGSVPDETMKPWRCANCGGILGMAVRTAGQRTVLHVLREVLPAESMLPDGLDEDGWVCAVDGDGVVRCLVCGDVRRWVGEDG